MKITQKIKSSELLLGSFWTIVGSGLSRLLITLGTIFSANLLGAEKFGEFSITRSTINVILVIAGLNIGSVLTKTIAEYKDNNPVKCARVLTLNYIFIFLLTLIFTFLTYIFSDEISFFVSKDKSLTDHFKLSSIILLFAIVFSLNESIYRGLGYYKRLGMWQILASVSFLIFVTLGAYKYGVTGAIIGYLIYTFVMTTVTLFDLHHISVKENFHFIKISNLRSEFADLRRLTIPIFFSSIIEAPVFWLAQVILIKYSGMISNGIASALLQTRNLMLIVPGYISLVVLPLLSKNIQDKNEYEKNFKNALMINTIIAVVSIAPLIFFPSLFLKIYGNDFNENFNYWDSFFAYISIPFVVVSNVYQQSIVAKGKGWNSMVISIIWNSALLTSVFIFSKYFDMGVTGYMLSLLIAIILQLLLRFLYAR